MVRRFSWVERTPYRYTTLPGTVSNHLVSRSFVWPPADHGAAALDWPTSQELDGRCLCTDDNGDDDNDNNDQEKTSDEQQKRSVRLLYMKVLWSLVLWSLETVDEWLAFLVQLHFAGVADDGGPDSLPQLGAQGGDVALAMLGKSGTPLRRWLDQFLHTLKNREANISHLHHTKSACSFKVLNRFFLISK